ncbi:MAG: trypsin-like serine protease [Trebonia sp.]
MAGLGAVAATGTVLAAAAAISVAVAGGTAQVAVASVADASVTSGGSMTAVTYQVSGTAQSGALAHWTSQRMRTATALSPVLVRSGLPATTQMPAQPAQSQLVPEVKAPKGIPRAVPFTGSPTTGALFYTTGGKNHFCTASVVDSTAGNMVLTAAHCVYWKGFATNIEYVPGYHNGVRPYGAWPVAKITVAGGWQSSHNPGLDFAFLTVAAVGGRQIQARTGGLTIGFTRWYTEKIEVIGHNDTDAKPVRCATKSFRFRTGQMEFYCHGFWAGTSGGPWIIGYNARKGTGTVFGVIGGYELGGNYEWASYSAYFGHSTRVLYQQAERQPASPKPSPSPSSTASASPSTSPSPPTAPPTTTSASASPSTSPSPPTAPPTTTAPTTTAPTTAAPSQASTTSSATPTPTSSPTGSASDAYRPVIQ